MSNAGIVKNNFLEEWVFCIINCTNFLPVPRRGGVELYIDRCITNDEGCGVEYSVALLHL